MYTRAAADDRNVPAYGVAERHVTSEQTNHYTLKAYVTARLSNEIIVSNKIIGSVKPVHVFILADKDKGPV